MCVRIMFARFKHQYVQIKTQNHNSLQLVIFPKLYSTLKIFLHIDQVVALDWFLRLFSECIEFYTRDTQYPRISVEVK